MESCSLPAFRDDGSAVTLAEILDRVSFGEKMRLSVIDFHGVGTAPEGLTMDEFERRSRRSPNGVAFSWQQLRTFANNLQQTIDCEIVGRKMTTMEESEELLPDSSRELVLSMLDSTRWEVLSINKALISEIASLA